MLGFEVAPTTASRSSSCCRCPPRIEPRERKSTHTLCPSAESRCSGSGCSEPCGPLAYRQRARRARGDALGGEAQLLQDPAAGGGGPEAVEAEHVPVRAHPLPPAHRRPRLDRQAGADRRRQHRVAVLLRLGFERAPCKASRPRARPVSCAASVRAAASVGPTSVPVEIRISSGSAASCPGLGRGVPQHVAAALELARGPELPIGAVERRIPWRESSSATGPSGVRAPRARPRRSRWRRPGGSPTGGGSRAARGSARSAGASDRPRPDPPSRACRPRRTGSSISAERRTAARM